MKALHSVGALSCLNQGTGNDYEMISGGFIKGCTAVV